MSRTKFLCGTVLKDHPQVQKQADIYPYVGYVKTLSGINVPKEFNGIIEWANVISPTQHPVPDAGDWAYATMVTVNIKMNLYAYKNFYIPEYNKVTPMLLIEKPPIQPSTQPSSQFNGQPKNIYNGYSIYDGFEFCYEHGFTSYNCTTATLLKENGIDIVAIGEGKYEDKIDIIKKNISQDITKPGLLDKTHCIKKYGDKYLARRVFTIEAIINIGEKGAQIQDKINDMKYDIYRFGPITAGMLVYDDFNGEGIYNGPSKNAKVIGGHAVVVLGWGVENSTEYWIIYSCWDDFGDDGVCKIKTGIKQCMLEDNAVAIVPKIPNSFLSEENLKIKYHNKDLQEIKINPQTFYTLDTTNLLESGILVNNFNKSEVTPLIENINLLNPTNNFMAAWVKYYSTIGRQTPVKNVTDYTTQESIILGIVSVLLFIFFYKQGKKTKS